MSKRYVGHITMGVSTCTASRNVGGKRKVRYPEVLDAHVAESSPNGLVEVSPGKHGRDRVGQVHQLSSPLGHFLRKK